MLVLDSFDSICQWRCLPRDRCLSVDQSQRIVLEVCDGVSKTRCDLEDITVTYKYSMDSVGYLGIELILISP